MTAVVLQTGETVASILEAQYKHKTKESSMVNSYHLLFVNLDTCKQFQSTTNRLKPFLYTGKYLTIIV